MVDPVGPKVSVGQHSEAGRKTRNEDSYGVVVPTGSMLHTKGIAMAIADGVSASEAGKEASETCIKSFLEDYYGTHESWTVKKSAAAVLCSTNQWLHRQGLAQFAADRAMVTTLSGVVLKAGMAHIFHVGDTQVALLRDGFLEPLTIEHRHFSAPNQKHLTRAFGAASELEIDYRKLTVRKGDVLVFTSDGVHEHMPVRDMQDVLTRGLNDLQAAARNIVSAAFQNESPDNLTCQLVRIDDPGLIGEEAHLERLQDLPFPHDLHPGMRFEGYLIESEVHASNRTQVYIARDPDTNERVIIKTPSVNFEDDPGYIEMFMREEWAGKRVQSPNVVRVLEPKGSRCFLYYVTEYVDGITLEDWMRENPAPSLVEVRGIADQIASGLRALHRKDMIHRDLKPGNVVIDAHGTVKIIDFGSAGIAGLDEVTGPVTLPSLVGTVDYTAPEFHFGHKPTNRSDIYSLGVIVYEMLTGKLPYGTGFENLRSTKQLTLTPAVQHRPSLPYWASEAISKAVHRDAAQRYDALSAFIADLARPNADFESADVKPLLDRDPATFWKAIALLSLLANLMLLALVSH